MASTTSLGPPLRILSWTLLAFSTVIVSMRFYAKARYTRKKIQIDDYFIAVALVFAIIAISLMHVSSINGIGSHVWTLQPEQLSRGIRFINMSNPFNSFGSMFGRISFAFFILNLLGPGEKKHKLCLFIIIAIQVVVNVAVVVQILTQCGRQIWLLWSLTNTAGKCVPGQVEASIGYFQSATNAACDLALTIIPLFVIKKLQALPAKVKLGLAGLLSLSLTACIASIVRAYYVRVLNDSSRLASSDFTYTLAELLICAEVELNVVIMAGSIPTLRPLLTRRDPNSSSYNYYSSTGNGTSTARNGATRSGTQPRRDVDDIEMMSDSASQEMILGEHQTEEKKTGITMSRQVEVSRV